MRLLCFSCLSDNDNDEKLLKKQREASKMQKNGPDQDRLLPPIENQLAIEKNTDFKYKEIIRVYGPLADLLEETKKQYLQIPI